MLNNKIPVSQILEFGNDKEYILRAQNSNYNSKDLIASLDNVLDSPFDVRRVETVGPRIGRELRSEALQAIMYALLGILFYIWYVYLF